MTTRKQMNTIFHERKNYLLHELQVIDLTIRNAQQWGEATEWMERLQSWRTNIQKLVEAMPEL